MKKIAMIGCGGIGDYHLSHLIDFDDINLAGFCDLIEERAEDFATRMAEKTGTKPGVYTNFIDMYNEIQPDAVFICVPPDCHGEIERETINRKIHFFVEKPVALDMALAYEIRDKAEAAGLITASGFQCRYSNLVEPNIEFLKTHQVPYVNCTRVGGIPEVKWWKNKKTSGGQLVEQAIHQLDILRYVFGEPKTVFSFAARGFVQGDADYDTDDLTTTVVRFESGALATIGVGCYATTGESFDSKITFSSSDCRADLTILGEFKIYGTTPTETADNNGLIVKGDGTMKAGAGQAVVYKQDGDAGILCDRTFIDAVITGDASKIRSPYADACKSLAFGLACNESMEKGIAINL